MDYFFARKEEAENMQTKVYLRDIFYIETIKGTHYCRILHKQGSNILHTDIGTLVKRLGFPFVKCRASTIVNVYNVEMIDSEGRMFYFSDGSRCDFSKAQYGHIKRYFTMEGQTETE